MLKPLSLVLLTTFVFAGCDAFSAGEALPFTRLEEASTLRVGFSGMAEFGDAPSWEAFWGAYGGQGPAPAIDFERNVVVGVFFGARSYSGCHGADLIREARREGSVVEVEVASVPNLGPCDAIVNVDDVVVVEARPWEVRLVGSLPG
jgi:hypothetical protein